MRLTVWVIGVGSADPQHLTGQAIEAMNAVDLFLVADKGEAQHDLAELRARLCTAVIRHDRYRIVAVQDPRRDREALDYDAAVQRWHTARIASYRDVITSELPRGGDIGFLVWGDPAFYDSTIRIAESLAGPGWEVDIRVIPGISSLQLLAAAHRISLNRIGRAVHVTTGRRLLAEFAAARVSDRPDPTSFDHPADPGDVVVLLDGRLACADLVESHPDLTIFWGAQLGLEDQCLVAGPLAEVITEIRRARDRIRSARGWVFDTYLLRTS